MLATGREVKRKYGASLVAAVGVLSGLLLVLGSLSCSGDCDRVGCEALEQPVAAATIAQGVVGVVASESDVEANGCQECPLSQATLHVWATASLATSREEVVDVVYNNLANETIDVDQAYELELEPGRYLICHLTGEGVCAAFAIGAGEVVTIHLKARLGPSELLVYEPGTNTPRTGGVFQLGEADVSPR